MDLSNQKRVVDDALFAEEVGIARDLLLERVLVLFKQVLEVLLPLILL